MTQNNAAKEIILPADVDGVACDGGDPALGHPKVWYNFGQAQSITCRYCDRLFVKSS